MPAEENIIASYQLDTTVDHDQFFLEDCNDEERIENLDRATPLLSAAQQEELRQALAGPAPQGERWTSRSVALWMSEW